ncbi:hypothetical protein R1sor_009965 [Riccia sorocarpa]|uniref:Uncharacterized protein n=1 Tax=Riccia sorocarpa TaxID=122646 RepID=A0ABD3HYL4_9MARC
MWEAGYRRLEDLLDEEEKHLVSWENKKIPVAESKMVEKAYNRLLGLITAPNDNRLNAEEKVLRYYETEDQAGYIWAWKAKAGEGQEAQTPPEEAERIRRFKVNGTWLQKCTAETQPRKEPIYKTAKVIAYREGQGKVLRARAEAFPEGASELARLRWKNGSDFFNASNRQIRKLLTRDAEAVVNKMKKWTSIAEIRCAGVKGTIGTKYKTRTMYFGYAKKLTWRRIEPFVAAVTSAGRRRRPKCNHILLAEDMPKDLKNFSAWWETIRGAILWAIWLARNATNSTTNDGARDE